MASMQAMIDGTTSYQSWAYCLSQIAGVRISKPAIFKRMNEAWVKTLKRLFEITIKENYNKDVGLPLFGSFVNVWVQDSTSAKLPSALFEMFKGSIAEKKKYSVAKLNCVINLVSGACKAMDWVSSNVTEQTLSGAILQIAIKGDLVIRDLGYFVLDIFKTMNESGIYFLTRWRYNVNLCDSATGKQICLEKLIKGKRYLDISILCGKSKIPMRLVVIKIDDDQAAKRRRKARKDHHRSVNHSKGYYHLLGYVIFLTNVGENIWTYRQVAEAYRMRWKIEILFKSWKSKLHLEEIIPKAQHHTERVEGWMYLILLYICWFQQMIYLPLLDYYKQSSISLIQLTQWAKVNTWRWLRGINRKLLNEIQLYCSYDTRRRINASKRLEQFLTPLG